MADHRWQMIGLSIAIVAALAFAAYHFYTPSRQAAQETDAPVPEASSSLSAPPSAAPEMPSAPAAVSSPSSQPSVSAAPADGLALINARRASAGALPLVAHVVLRAEAQRHAEDMARRNYFDHTTPEGITFAQRMAATAYPAEATSENIGLTSTRSMADVVQQWMDSPGHRENLLDPFMQTVGIGTATGTYEGMTVLYVVAIFGASE